MIADERGDRAKALAAYRAAAALAQAMNEGLFERRAAAAAAALGDSP